MLPDFAPQLRTYAEVIVRVGLNLQPGQPLLITDPYDLQGIHPEAASLAEAIRSVVSELEPGRPRPGIAVIQSDTTRLRALVEANDLGGFETLVSAHTRRLQQHLACGGAFLFLTDSEPHLMAGLPAERLHHFDRLKWRHLGPIIQRLIRGASQWTLAPAPSSAWADAAYAELPAAERLPALWRTVFQALRIDGSNVGGSLSPDSALSGHKAPPTWQTSGRHFHHTLLDENAVNHIALGDAYRFCSRAFLPLALNSSQVHLDLPLAATAELS